MWKGAPPDELRRGKYRRLTAPSWRQEVGITISRRVLHRHGRQHQSTTLNYQEATRRPIPRARIFSLPPSIPSLSDMKEPVGIAHLPNQCHRIVAKRGIAFNLMVCGESGTGKTTFINTLFATTIKESRRRPRAGREPTVEIEITHAELEEQHFQMKLTVIDTPGLGDYVNNRDGWRPIVEYIDDQHERYMRQEQQPQRQLLSDSRVHACVYFIRPTGHTLKPLDVEVMKRLGSRVNLIPVIAKADTLTVKDMAEFKQRVRDVISAQRIRVYAAPIESEDEATTMDNKDIMNAMPFSVIGSRLRVSTPGGRKNVIGRPYTWGIAEVENPVHCDFSKLRSILIRSHMLDLVTTTQEEHYENYRREQMASRKFGEAKPLNAADYHRQRDKEDALRRAFKVQVKQEEQRFRQWEQQLIVQRDRLNYDLETLHAEIKAMENDLEIMYRGTAIRRG
ncbi:cell division control protein [Syncephalastrum racemosum]|uniref:Cell division control protein n=1 Tax=Syncephalastrum racemosum TaxID=13706 RepID=A0A1X2HCQ6_SYNRA|nr:cell division control protein [Syncephalastrum racemosum]